jgi:hypothetical protein
LKNLLESGQAGSRRQRQRLFFHLYRNDGRPVSIHLEQGLKALSFPWLYPDGQNHWSTNWQIQIGTKMYFCQRLMNKDKRFQEPDYVGWAVSTAQYFELLDSISVALRMQRGSTNVGTLISALQDARL